MLLSVSFSKSRDPRKNLTEFCLILDLSETHCNNSPLALINNQVPWDMHRPLEDSCTIQLLNFKMTDPSIVNRAFWRTCSFLLGAVMQKTFKEDAGLQLHSFPYPSVRSGSFVHDICLKEPNWDVTVHELRALGAEMVKLAARNVRLERLEVSHEVALEMFMDNPFKREQLPSISNKNKGVVTLYRVEDHIDISKGPMVGSTRFLQRVHISSVHKVSDSKDPCNLYRVQGVALPMTFSMSAFAFNILTDRAKKLVSVQLLPALFPSFLIKILIFRIN